jgi:protein dithiol:quinone oxidoreductase
LYDWEKQNAESYSVCSAPSSVGELQRYRSHQLAPIIGAYKDMTLKSIFDWTDRAPRQVFALVALICAALLAFGLYLQHVVGLEPCPMCIVQRYALVLVAVCAGLTGATGRRSLQVTGAVVLVVLSVLGAYVAARQSWLQWYPPEVVSCGRDLYGMIETFPLKRALPMIFRGGGDCSKVDWTFLTLTIANWSFLCFSAIALLSGLMAWRGVRRA